MASIKGMGQHCRALSRRQGGRAFLPAVPSSCRRPATRVFCQPSPVDQQPVAPVPDASTQPALTPGYPMPIPPPGVPLDSSSSAVYMQTPPPGYGYQIQGRDGQQYYMAPPPGYYPPPPPYAATKVESSSGAPWWIWVGVGIAASTIFGKVQELMKKGPQQMMTEMAMKQMMGAMGNQANSPFGKPGSMPPFPQGFPPMPPSGFPNPPSASTVDVSSSTPTATSSPPASDSSTKKGEKFASRLASSPPPSPGASSTPTKEKSDAEKSLDVVDPIVREPPSSRGSGSSSSFFAQASAADTSKAAGSSDSGSSSAGNGAGAAAGGGSVMMETMEAMLRNPQMQQMLYPYLPEPMRNPQSIEWMLNNPEVKKQMAQMFEQQNMMSPQMMDMMKNMDLNQDKVNQQFQELGLKPEDVISKVMANPELAAGFQDPKVQAAIMDISQNPMNIVKYQSDPQVMKVLNEVTTLFQPDIPPNKRV